MDKTIAANARLVVNSLMAEPDALPFISACALAGNAYQENLMQPITRGPKDHGSDGLFQWRLSRLDELQRRPGWQTIPVQCQFAKDELKRDYPTLWGQLVNPGNRTLENLTLNFCDVFERPSKAGRAADKRIAYAHQVYDLLANAAPVPVPPPPPPVQVPMNVPPILIQAFVAILNNAFNGKRSSLIGSALIAFAGAVQFKIPILGYLFAGSGLPWLIAGLTLIFGAGAAHPPPPEPEEPSFPLPPQPQEPTMTVPVVIPAETAAKLVALIEAVWPKLETMIPALQKVEPFLPIIEEVGKDLPLLKDQIPALKNELDDMRAKFESLFGSDGAPHGLGDLNARIDNLFNAIKGHNAPAQNTGA